MKKSKTKRLNSKGFSLVELLIVIVIMAILVGIVGTQVIPYITKAQKSRDQQKISACCTDAMTAYTSCEVALDESKTYIIEITKSGSSWTVSAKEDSGTACPKLKKEFLEVNAWESSPPKFQSADGKAIQKVIMKCKNVRPLIELTVIGPVHPEDFSVEAE